MSVSRSLVASICERCGHVGKWVSPSYPSADGRIAALRATQETLRDALLDIKDLIEVYVDVRDSGDGFGVVPNKAMQAETLIDKALASLSSDPETPK